MYKIRAHSDDSTSFAYIPNDLTVSTIIQYYTLRHSCEIRIPCSCNWKQIFFLFFFFFKAKSKDFQKFWSVVQYKLKCGRTVSAYLYNTWRMSKRHLGFNLISRPQSDPETKTYRWYLTWVDRTWGPTKWFRLFISKLNIEIPLCMSAIANSSNIIMYHIILLLLSRIYALYRFPCI